MKILSYNCRGFANQPKKLALRRLLSLSLSDIIFLQETLCPTDSLTPTLRAWMPNWTLHALDASRRSGGLAIGFNITALRINNIWGGRGFIGIDAYVISMEFELRIINVYGSCTKRVDFWHSLLNSAILQ